jgi:pyruvate formate-lyase activating enzyme-like uncharacterized protein
MIMDAACNLAFILEASKLIKPLPLSFINNNELEFSLFYSGNLTLSNIDF